MSFLNEKKIKPYAVVDLSAHTILSSDEIEQCLQEASHKQRLKFVGDYAYNGNHAKENGDAPNFIAIPPKKRSKSLSALYDELLKSEEEKNIRKSSDNTGTMCQNAYSQITPTTTTPSGYDVITGRERSYTAPATVYDVVRIKSSRRRKTSKGQKTPSMLPKQSGLRAPSASGMRQPSARAPSSTHETPKPSGLKPPGEAGNATPRNSNNNIIAKQPQSIQRSTLPRMSKKNSDTHSSSPDSSSGSEGGQRSTPASALSVQSPRPLASKPPLAGIPQPKSAVKTRSPNTTAGNESKEQLQRMKREKSADCLRTKREKSSECIRKISTPGNLSAGNSRLKKSSENLLSYSRESTAENLKKEGSLRSKESGIVTPRDTKESGITPPRPGMIKMNSSSGLKKPSGLVGPRKISAPAAPNESKMKPPASGLSRPSGIGKPSGLAKPSGIAKANSTASRDNLSNKSLTKDDDKVNTNSTENVSKLTPPKEQVSKISPPKQSKEQPSKIASSKEQASRIASPVTSRKLASPSTPRRMASPSTPRKIPLLNGPTRRASDGTLGLQTKSRLEVNASQKKKLSDLSTHEESINEIAERNETRELKYPIVGGKLPDRLGDTNRFINKSLRFQPNPKLTKPTKPTEKESTEEPTVSDIETPTNENLVAPPEEFVGESVERDDAADELSIANDFVASETSTLGKDGNIVSNILGDDEQREPTDTEEDTEIEESENEDIRFPKNSISSLPEKDPFAEFDTSFDTSQLTGIDQHFDTSKLTGIDDYEPTETTFTKLKQRPISESDSDIDSDHPKSVYDESEIPKPDYTNLGYTEPDDSIKRSEQLSSDSGYIEPLDTPSSSRNSLPYRKQSGSNASSVPDDISSNESNPSPRFGEENDQAGSPSHFKRVQPKVLIPPPRINSYTEDLLAPLPKDYMRTPSSDMEEIHLVQSHAEVELRRKVREQAFKVWGKKHAQKDTVTESDENEEHLLDGDYNDVFYTKEMEQKSNTLERYAHRTSLRRESDDESRLSMEKNLRQLETMTLDRKEKKTSKIKKFFKKLSNKKDAAKYDQEFSSRNDRLPSTDSEHSTQHISNSTGYDLKSRRRSDGTISLYSVSETNYLTQATPLTKRRLFAINLSFMKKGRRRNNNSITTHNDSTSSQPSETVRALCSPYANRRNRLTPMTPISANGRRASESTVYKIQHNNDLNTNLLLQRHNTATGLTSTPLRHSGKKYRAPQPPSHISSTQTTPLDAAFRTKTIISPCAFPPMSSRGDSSRSSTSSGDEEADYINYPFSKSNVKAPQKPNRTASKGSCPDGYGNRSNSLSSSSKASNEDYPPSTKHHDLVFKNKRHSLTSDDSMIMSSESLSSSQGHGNNEVFDRQHSARKSNTRADSSLRKTPLRNSIDSYNRLLEVHRHTIDKIAFEVSRLVCTCQQLQTTDWNNYERSDDVIQLGVPGYMVVPVTCAKSEQKNYTAWLRINEGNEIQSASSSNLTTTTLHRNCLHICHVIEPTSPTPTNEQPSKSIESNRAFISTQLPKMPLSKYVSSTIEKHTRYPEIYERETALILLQVVKGVLHLVRKRAPIKTVNAENIFILNTGGSDPTAVISPTQQSPKCPSVVVGCLPGIGDQSVSTSSTDVITNLCHQMAFLLYELLHSSFEEELKLIVNSPMLFTTLPDLTIKSIYSRYLQSIIDKLLGTPQHTINSLDELRLTLEVILFGPTDICDHEEKEALDLIKKWHNRRCVDMVTYILKEAPLIMLCASEHHGQEVEKIKRVDQEILLECEFLSSIMPVDIYRVSKELRR
ncbi:serine-rich adhesin for platelets-like isoform X2 [Clytia hemisphaerica]|uniref:serine-rich adhesin for platelets-like isoform X2 n=1 Tax=Clytia hemisphaerica TaxID=252671 RepID=UPI0034D5C46E